MALHSCRRASCLPVVLQRIDRRLPLQHDQPAAPTCLTAGPLSKANNYHALRDAETKTPQPATCTAMPPQEHEIFRVMSISIPYKPLSKPILVGMRLQTL